MESTVDESGKLTRRDAWKEREEQNEEGGLGEGKGGGGKIAEDIWKGLEEEEKRDELVRGASVNTPIGRIRNRFFNRLCNRLSNSDEPKRKLRGASFRREGREEGGGGRMREDARKEREEGMEESDEPKQRGHGASISRSSHDLHSPDRSSCSEGEDKGGETRGEGGGGWMKEDTWKDEERKWRGASTSNSSHSYYSPDPISRSEGEDKGKKNERR
jgi:hypothetical protein